MSFASSRRAITSALLLACALSQGCGALLLKKKQSVGRPVETIQHGPLVVAKGRKVSLEARNIEAVESQVSADLVSMASCRKTRVDDVHVTTETETSFVYAGSSARSQIRERIPPGIGTEGSLAGTEGSPGGWAIVELLMASAAGTVGALCYSNTFCLGSGDSTDQRTQSIGWIVGASLYGIAGIVDVIYQASGAKSAEEHDLKRNVVVQDDYPCDVTVVRNARGVLVFGDNRVPLSVDSDGWLAADLEQLSTRAIRRIADGFQVQVDLSARGQGLLTLPKVLVPPPQFVNELVEAARTRDLRAACTALDAPWLSSNGELVVVTETTKVLVGEADAANALEEPVVAGTVVSVLCKSSTWAVLADSSVPQVGDEDAVHRVAVAALSEAAPWANRVRSAFESALQAENVPNAEAAIANMRRMAESGLADRGQYSASVVVMSKGVQQLQNELERRAQAAHDREEAAQRAAREEAARQLQRRRQAWLDTHCSGSLMSMEIFLSTNPYRNIGKCVQLEGLVLINYLNALQGAYLVPYSQQAVLVTAEGIGGRLSAIGVNVGMESVTHSSGAKIQVPSFLLVEEPPPK